LNLRSETRERRYKIPYLGVVLLVLRGNVHSMLPSSHSDILLLQGATLSYLLLIWASISTIGRALRTSRSKGLLAVWGHDVAVSSGPRSSIVGKTIEG
jgi:hypothetical protein